MARRRPTWRALSDEELLAEAGPWWARGRELRGGRGDPDWEAWSVGFHAWCDQHGVDTVELLRLRRVARLREVGA